MTMGKRGETEGRAQGLDARLEAGLHWSQRHWRGLLVVVAALLLLGLATAGTFEYRQRAEARAQLVLARVESAFFRALGSDPADVLAREPANSEVARAARENARAEYQGVVEAHAGTRAAQIAGLAAAEMSVALENWEEALEGLDAALAALAAGDALRAVALRLKGYVLEQQGLQAEAGAAYVEGARVEAYPGRGALWIAAGQAFERAGADDQAIDAYQEALSRDPEFAELTGALSRLYALTGGF